MDSNFEKSPETQQKIDQMGYQKTDEISFHAELGQQKIKEEYIQSRCVNVIAKTIVF